MTRSVRVTAWCDGMKPHALAGNGQPYRPGQLRRCGRSMEATSHVTLTKKLAAGGWVEEQDGTLKCPECLERVAKGLPTVFEKREV